MIRRIFKRFLQVIKEEFEWSKTRVWLRSRAVRWAR